MNQEFIYALYIYNEMNSVKQLYQTYTNPITAIKQIIKFIKINQYCENNRQIELLNNNLCFYKTKQFDFQQLNFNHDSNIYIQVSQNGVTIGFGNYDYIIQTIKHIPK